jgi:hypothetical protein
MREAIRVRVREDRKKWKALQRSLAMEQIGRGSYENHIENLEGEDFENRWYRLGHLDPSVGEEIKKKRPVVVLNNGHEKHLRLAIVVPVTNWTELWESNPFFVSIDPSKQKGLKKNRWSTVFKSGRLDIGESWTGWAPSHRVN